MTINSEPNQKNHQCDSMASTQLRGLDIPLLWLCIKCNVKIPFILIFFETQATQKWFLKQKKNDTQRRKNEMWKKNNSKKINDNCTKQLVFLSFSHHRARPLCTAVHLFCSSSIRWCWCCCWWSWWCCYCLDFALFCFKMFNYPVISFTGEIVLPFFFFVLFFTSFLNVVSGSLWCWLWAFL